MSVIDHWLSRQPSSLENREVDKAATGETFGKTYRESKDLLVAKCVVSSAALATAGAEESQISEALKQDLRQKSPQKPPAFAYLSQKSQESGSSITSSRAANARSEPTLTSDLAGCRKDWCYLYEERAAIREYDGHYTRAEAERLAWGEMQSRWHIERGERVPRDLCAGCRRSIGSAKVLELIDGCRVHLTDDNACLVRHGGRWRAAATRALIALGVKPPATKVGEEGRQERW
jgi:hypothetical protein